MAAISGGDLKEIGNEGSLCRRWCTDRLAWRASPGRARRRGCNTNDAGTRAVRDRHVQHIAEKGRMAWQKATGYGRRSLVETTIGRYKHIIGPKLRARSSGCQQGDVAIAVQVSSTA